MFDSVSLIRDHGGMTNGLAVLAAWVMFGLLLLALSVVILRGDSQ
jgi:hypothetical protein